MSLSPDIRPSRILDTEPLHVGGGTFIESFETLKRRHLKSLSRLLLPFVITAVALSPIIPVEAQGTDNPMVEVAPTPTPTPKRIRGSGCVRAFTPLPPILGLAAIFAYRQKQKPN